jgi:hypothetical protein
MRETVMTQSAKPLSPPKAVTEPRLQADTDLFNAIVDREAVRCAIKHPIDSSTIEVLETANSKIAYPWNPGLPESADFFNHLATASPLDAFDANEIDSQADRFFSQLDQLWDNSLQTVLARKFASVPQEILRTIAQQAENLSRQGDQLVDQLAQCVQAAMPQWALEDLQVLSRPLAYAMRGTAPELPTDSPLANRDWQTLSTTEQAKLSLTIARYAIDELARSDESV